MHQYPYIYVTRYYAHFHIQQWTCTYSTCGLKHIPIKCEAKTTDKVSMHILFMWLKFPTQKNVRQLIYCIPLPASLVILSITAGGPVPILVEAVMLKEYRVNSLRSLATVEKVELLNVIGIAVITSVYSRKYSVIKPLGKDGLSHSNPILWAVISVVSKFWGGPDGTER